MKSKSDPLTVKNIDKASIAADDLKDYEEDLEGTSIDNWIRDKVVAMKLINQKIDFITFEDWAVRYNEVFIPGVPMGNGLFSDTGYRFRYNDFQRQDGWLIPKYIPNPFYDYIFYSSDTYPSAPVDKDNKPTKIISEMYFRLAVDQMTHTREVYFFMDFIGDIGGVTGILL